MKFKYISCLWLFIAFSQFNVHAQVKTGAEQMNLYLPLLKAKKVALVMNQTAMIGSSNLLDTLRKRGVTVTCIFAPEHGFRGNYGAGEKVTTTKDAKSGLPVYSLYGENKKPTPKQLALADIIVFDIQDVGVRFYTYISTLHYVMEACAEAHKPLLILDRPNPNGFYIDGPVLDSTFKSFVGMHPVPIVHGCTIGEYARMINGEGWLKDKKQVDLKIIKVSNYTHSTAYQLPVKPSPNLPTMNAVFLYPGLCLFEGTHYSVGRGTAIPFECVGKPDCEIGAYHFTPKSIPSVADHPVFEGKDCRGFLLSDYAKNVAPAEGGLNLFWLIDLYKHDKDSSNFFTPFFDQLAGTDQLRKQIQQGLSEEQIRKSWQPAIRAYKTTRAKYILYRD